MMLLFLSLMSFGNVELFMKAKTAAQIEQVHQQVVQEKILKERCDIEIRQNWIPVSCFEWLEKVPKSPFLDYQMRGYLNKRCLVALQGHPPLPPARAFKYLTPGICQESVQKYSLDRQYQMAAEGSFAKVANSLEVGKEFVKESGHEVQKADKDQRLPSYRALRRGPN